MSWNTANDAVLAEGKRVLINDPHRFDGVQVLGVDEHVWRHTRHGDKYVTVIIDLTPIRDDTGPARLLDMVEGRSEQAFKTWLGSRPQAWRAGVEVVAMDGFTGFKTATTEELPGATAVMDPFHVVRLAGDALDQCRRRVQQELHGHRGSAQDPLYRARRTLHTGADLLTPRKHARIDAFGGCRGRFGGSTRWRRRPLNKGDLGQSADDDVETELVGVGAAVGRLVVLASVGADPVGAGETVGEVELCQVGRFASPPVSRLLGGAFGLGVLDRSG